MEKAEIVQCCLYRFRELVILPSNLCYLDQGKCGKCRKQRKFRLFQPANSPFIMNKMLQTLPEAAISLASSYLTPTNLLYLLLSQLALPASLSYLLYLFALDQTSLLALVTAKSLYAANALYYAESAKSLYDSAQSWKPCYYGSTEDCTLQVLTSLCGQKKADFLSELIDFERQTIASDSLSKIQDKVEQVVVDSAKEMAFAAGRRAMKNSKVVKTVEGYGFKFTEFTLKALRSLWK